MNKADKTIEYYMALPYRMEIVKIPDGEGRGLYGLLATVRSYGSRGGR